MPYTVYRGPRKGSGSQEGGSGKMRVLVLDKCDPSAVKLLTDAGIEADEKAGLSEEELIKIVPTYDAMVVRSATIVTPKIIQAATRMRIIGRAGVGVDNIDIPAATNQGIVVVNSPQGNTTSAAEHTWAMILSMARQIPQAHNKLKQGVWDRKTFMGLEMEHKTLGVLGFGNIGKRVAKYALAFGMKVLAYDPYVKPEQGAKLGVTISSMETIFASADVITLHLPSIKETQKIINAKTIATMKRGVLLANVARGECVDEEAVAEAVKSGHIARAALDVFSPEPLSKDSPLLGVDNIIVTPHLGASTAEAQVKVAVDVCEQIIQVFNGGAAHAALNIPTMQAHLIEPVQHFLSIAEKLGALVVQLVKSKVSSVLLEAAGVEEGTNLAPVATCFMKGFLDRIHTAQSVNFVNAPKIFKDLGVSVDTRPTVNENFGRILSASATMEDGSKLQIAGAHFEVLNADRILEFDGRQLDVAIGGWMLWMSNPDKPGMIGKVGTFIGRHSINISTFQVAPTWNGEAGMIVTLDDELPEALLEELKKEIPEVADVRLVYC
jgi:D-3-phosphoglycerate dehydrogenase